MQLECQDFSSEVSHIYFANLQCEKRFELVLLHNQSASF